MPGRARAHFDADTRARYVGARLRIEFALFDPPIDGRRPADQDVERIAGGGASLEIGGQTAVDIEPVARRAFELGADLGEHGRNRSCRPDLDLGRFPIAG